MEKACPQLAESGLNRWWLSALDTARHIQFSYDPICKNKVRLEKAGRYWNYKYVSFERANTNDDSRSYLLATEVSEGYRQEADVIS